MNRRTFIRTTAATTIALSPMSPLLALEADHAYRKNIGLQLYTLRNEIAKDPVGTLKQVAADGYRQVEPFGFPNAKAMISAARDAGLAIHSTHFEWDCVVNPKDAAMSDFSRILDKAKRIGLSHLVIPCLQGDPNSHNSLGNWAALWGLEVSDVVLSRPVGRDNAYIIGRETWRPRNRSGSLGRVNTRRRLNIDLA